MPRRIPDRSGFTLLEVLFAVALTAGILVIIFAGFRMAQRSVEKAEARIEDSLRYRLLYDRLSALIRSAYPYRGLVDDNRRELFFLGESDEVGFVTAEVDRYAGNPANAGGFRWVKLALDRRRLVLMEGLYFDPAVLESDPEVTDVIDPEVEQIAIEYYNREADEDTGEWVDSWDPEDHDDRLPGALRLSLRVREGSGVVAVGPLVFRIPLGGPEKKP